MSFQSYRGLITIFAFVPITIRTWARYEAFLILPGYIKEAKAGILCDKLCVENGEFRLVFSDLTSVSLVIFSMAILDNFLGNWLFNLTLFILPTSNLFLLL